MGLKEWILPQEMKFFERLCELSKVLRECSVVFQEAMQDFGKIDGSKTKLKEIEHRADEIVHGIYEELNTTFITPIDREDIASLASATDDVIDYTYLAVNRIHLFRIREPTKPMQDLAMVLRRSVEELVNAFDLLGDMKNADRIEKSCVEVNRLENVADDLLNDAIAELFSDSKPLIDIIKLKETYEFLERATDKCEDVANVLSDIVVKYR